jgi:phage I-like protein
MTKKGTEIIGAEYPWDQCIADQTRRYGDKETAQRVCGRIKADYGKAVIGEETLKSVEKDLGITVPASIEGKLLMDADGSFVCALELPADLAPESGVPTRIPLLPLGTWKGYVDPETGKKKSFTTTSTDVDNAIEFLHRLKARHPKRDLVIDNDHRTLKDEYAPAFGWIKDFFKMPNGWLGAVVDWTELGITNISKKFYRYISPVFKWDAVDKETGEKIPFAVLQAGLVNEPFFDSLEVVQAKHIIPLSIDGKDTIMDELVQWLRSFLNLPLSSTVADIQAELQKIMDQLKQSASAATITAKQVVDIFKASVAAQTARTDLIGILGLKPEATHDELKAKATDLVGALAFKGEVITALGLKPEATLEEVKAMVISGKGAIPELATVTARVRDLETKEAEREFERIVAKAFFEGKILPTQKMDAEWIKTHKDLLKAKGSAGYEEYWSKQAVIAPVGQLPMGSIVGRDGGLTEDDKHVAGLLGVKEDIVLKHNKVQ